MTFKLTEENYRGLFENSNDAMWVHDLAGNFIVVNKALEKLTGFDEGELLSKNIKDFLIGDALVLARDLRYSLIHHSDFPQPYKQQVIRKDGNIRTMKMSTSLVIIDGKPAGFQHIARDVTEEQSLTEMLTEITNGSPIPTFVIDLNHLITHWNAALESLTGQRTVDMLGTDKQWQTFYSQDRPTLADLIIGKADENQFQKYYGSKYKLSTLMKGAYEAEDYFPLMAKTGRWLHFTASPIKNGSGQVIAALEAFQDITEEKRMQESMRFYVQLITRAQEEERKRLARDLHDDLSSSLLLLIQRLDTAVPSHRSRSSAVKTNMEDLRTQAVEALEHVRRYVQNLRPRILDDLGLIASLEWMAEDMQKKYAIQTKVTVQGGENPLSADVQLLLFRIAQEALSNIRRHSRAAASDISVQVASDEVIMTISDTGGGFAVPVRIEDLPGTGHLGIMGMTERARLLGGSLEIKSSLGHGTSVTTRIPLHPALKAPLDFTGEKPA